MPTSAFYPFDSFLPALANKKINLETDTFKFILTNTAPNAATHTVKTDITEITAQNGYPAGGVTLDNPTVTAIASGGFKWLIDDEVITASGGSFGPYRYGVIYDDTATNDDLIGYVDYGSALTTNDTETLTANADNTNGVFDIHW